MTENNEQQPDKPVKKKKALKIVIIILSVIAVLIIGLMTELSQGIVDFFMGFGGHQFDIIMDGESKTVDISPFRLSRFKEGKLLKGEHAYENMWR